MFKKKTKEEKKLDEIRKEREREEEERRKRELKEIMVELEEEKEEEREKEEKREEKERDDTEEKKEDKEDKSNTEDDEKDNGKKNGKKDANDDTDDEDEDVGTDIKVLDADSEISSVEEYRNKANNFINKLKNDNNPWGLSPRAMDSRRAALASLAVKDGLQARVPIICKGSSCPYSQSCQLLKYDMAPRGEYCAVELAQIDIRSMGYAKDIGYEESSFTDRMMMNELITLDIMLERCKALMAKEGTPIIDMAIGVDQEGNEIRQPNVSKAWEAYEKISKKRDQTYQLLMITRKDQKNKDADADAKSVSSVLQDVINSTAVDI